MRAPATIAALIGGLFMAGTAIAQTATPPSNAPAAASEPKILNAPKPAERPASSAEPYAGQKPVATGEAAATSGPAPTAAAPASEPASAPAAQAAATAAKAAAETPKKEAAIPEGPAIKPIDGAAPATAKSASEASKASEAKTEAKTDIVPTVAKPEPPKPTLLVAIDLTSQKLSVTENGIAKYKWSISSGRTGYLTPKGTFRPVWMSKMWYSKKYDYAPMPHAIFFHGGAAIHGTDSVYALGRPASHGCVRLSPSNAAALYRLVEKHGKQFTRITVFGTPKQGPLASNSGDDGERGYRQRRYEQEPWWNDDDGPPPVARRRAYSDRYYDGRPARYAYPPRQRRYVRDYEPYGFDD